MRQATFRLSRYFVLTSASFFVLVGAALGYFNYVNAVQRLQRLEESGNVRLTRLLANVVWEPDLVPLLREARERGSAGVVGNPMLEAIHEKTVSLMRGTDTFKVKVYDEHGLTVYSTDPQQIGEDRSDNLGFRGALAGEVLSELVRREGFSVLEQMSAERDLVQSYIPRTDPATGRIVGVFEVYSDVTRYVSEIRRTSLVYGAAIAVAFGALFLILYLIVRRAQGLIDRQAAEARLAQQHVAQTEKMASLGQLVASVAHQLNTPLAFSGSNLAVARKSLLDLAPALRAADALGEAARRTPPNQPLAVGAASSSLHEIRDAEQRAATVGTMLGDVMAGVEQMQEMVRHLLDFTHLDRGNVVEADLNALLRTVCYIARSSTPSAVAVVEDLAAVPPIDCNPSQLNQVFLNLITNAAQAIEGAGTVTVRSRPEDGRIRVDVADDGSGIATDVLPHIFDTYYTTKPRGVGTGLGLPIARDIVREHGGEIRVDSAPGRGSVFSVFLPAPAARSAA